MQKAEIVLPWKISTVKSAKVPKIGIKTLCVKAPKIAQMVKKNTPFTLLAFYISG